MTGESSSVFGLFDDDLAEMLKWEAAEARLAGACDDHPLGYSLVMAALAWEEVDQRGWRRQDALCTQARRLMATRRVPPASVDDAEAVAAALAWATREPALLECDSQGRYRPVFVTISANGTTHWLDCHRAAVVSGALTPLELVEKGDTDQHGDPADLDAAEASYQLAVDSDDVDAAAVAALRLAELAETRDQPAEAARRYADVAALQHPIASPSAVLRLARHAAAEGDRPRARALAGQVVAGEDPALLPKAWALLGSLAWLDDDRDTAVAAMRRAVDTAGEWHGRYTRCLAVMLAEGGDVSGAAEAYRVLLGQPFWPATSADEYVSLMSAAGRIEEAVSVLEECAAADGLYAGRVLLALVSAHATREDIAGAQRTLGRVRAHWSARVPDIAVRADVYEASLAAAEGDDERAAELYRSLTDSDDTERRDLARPLLIASGEHFAAQGRPCLIPGSRPLLEYLSEAAPPATAAWAAVSLAHLATVEGRPDDAEAAVGIAARHQRAEEVTVLRAGLLRRAGRDRDALDCLVNACTADAAPTPALTMLLPVIADFGMRGIRLDAQQRTRLRAVADRAIFDGAGDRDQVACAMAQVEMHASGDRGRAVDLWDIATDSNEPGIAALAWFNIGRMRRFFAPVRAVHAFEQAILVGDTTIAGRAAAELVTLAEGLGDQTVVAWACERALDFTEGADRALAALRLGRINQYDHPDDAEEAYHAAIAEPGAHPATVGAALARLGALYAMHGNRRLAQQAWRRGRRHRDPRIASAFAAERAAIGRVTRIRDRSMLY
jgi:tetratricopeptide (TPR) repeat protein